MNVSVWGKGVRELLSLQAFNTLKQNQVSEADARQTVQCFRIKAAVQKGFHILSIKDSL